MKKLWLALCIVVVLMVSGCGSIKEETADMFRGESSTDSMMAGKPAAEMPAPAMDVSFSEEIEADVDYGANKDNSVAVDGEIQKYNEGNEGGSATLYERKIVKTGFVYMETLDYDQTIVDVKKMINKYNGYTAYSESNGGSLYENSYNSRYARFTIKIPAEMFEEMYEELNTIGNVLNTNEGKNDVTAQFVDIEARLTTLLVQEERLLSILEKTEVLEDVIELEYALQETRYEIERNTTNLRNLEDQVRFSTIELTVQEVYEETIIDKPVITFSDKISEGLKETYEEISEGVQNLIIFLVTQFPYILFTLFVIGMGVLFYKKLSKKEKLEVARRADSKAAIEDKEE